MNNPPQIQGYQFDQRLLVHPLAEIWRGRSFTGMEVVALVLSTAGAADPQVRERLGNSSRSAALSPGRQETPLWAANLNSDHPYAITQLIPGQSGAERLLDPLDGLLGNDEQSLDAVRSQLSQYGGTPPEQTHTAPELPSYGAQDAEQPAAERSVVQDTAAAVQPVGKVELAREYSRKLGSWVYVVVVLIVLIAFTITYSVGAAVGSAVKKEAAAPISDPVKPAALPTSVLLPGVSKVTTAAYIRTGGPGLVGQTYPSGTDVQVIKNLDLPFAFGWPRPPSVRELGESSTTLYRQVQTVGSVVNPTKSSSALIAKIAVRQCRDLAGCLGVRTAFDEDWTKAFRAPAPRTAKDARTWYSVSNTDPYTLVMTRAYSDAGRWWLVGVAVSAVPEEVPSAQGVFNDIWRQTN
ncbi:hypothetical protein F1D05_22075 [Kribbella qitaiheensis]|uniref:Uncharacterized protein n=1 Tax=Kribbella qitaiheensis TaxID=1544730 RepID=A0A7G6X1J4_9ACTN|nr:hypothetical protein [Kribbella qitaiheensis]QNE20109.1 hypothetical protein F1D05_22075 [Kribbella qitaiheensis]